MPSVVVGIVGQEIVDRNAGRQTIMFTNRSAGGQIITLDMCDALGLTILNGGYVIAPGAPIAFLLDFDGPDIQGKWSAVSDVAGALLYWKETNRRR